MLGLLAVTGVAALGLGVGAFHMLAPDHWVPLVVYCNSKGIPARRVSFLAVAGGLAHTAGSLIAMVIAIAVGQVVATSFSGASGLLVGLSFLAVGAWKFVSTVRERGSDPEKKEVSQGTKWLVFAATSSPELTIFPVYLAASVFGLLAVALALGAFAAGTIISLVAVTLAGTKGMGRFLRVPGRERQIDYAIALVLLALGVFVVAGG